MNHSLKMKLRELSHRSKAFSAIYHKASGVKVDLRQDMSDEEFLRRKFKENTGEELDLDNPQTFNMKLQWLKLHDHNPLYTSLVDKYAVKAYVAERIGKEHVIPVVGGPWESADDIDFDALPEKFVLKCNHDCGSVVICTDKAKLNYAEVRRRLTKCLRVNYYNKGREWPYKNVKPCIFAEKYMVDESGVELKDYKFFCFGGEPKMMFIAGDRMNTDEETKFDFFDMGFNHLPFTNGHPNADILPRRPESFDYMKELASRLSVGIPQVRVDFYEVLDNVFFGEMTFYHWGGMMPFDPPEWDYTLGSWIDLSSAYNSPKSPDEKGLLHRQSAG